VSRHDLAIYLPSTAGFYDRTRARSAGAERQMTLLARVLSERGVRVAQVVWPIADRLPLPNERLTLVERPKRQIGGGLRGVIREAWEIWRALAAADGAVVVVRKRQGALPFAAFFCLLRRRKLVFSSANNADFLPERFSDGHPGPRLYALCLRSADAVVVQSKDQLALAREAFPNLRLVRHIPSFAESLRVEQDSAPDAFVWIGRIVEDKQPLRFIELARALPEARFVMILVPDISALDSPLIPVVRAAPEQTPNLEVLDPLPHDEAIRRIGSAVAVVNTTSRFEGMPNVFLEGWAAGVPALSLEFDPDGVIAENGLGIAANGSWERFVDAARELWRGRTNRMALSERTRSYVEHTHSLDAVGRQWIELIDQLSKRKNRSSRSTRPAASGSP
jgi:glycosyltransferase involved in cell wall biosynthesis